MTDDGTEPWVNIVAVNLFLEIDPSLLSVAEGAVLMCLCIHANENGISWPSLTTIAREAKTSRQTVQASLASLEDKGFILRDRYKPAIGQARRPSGYKLHGEWASSLPNRIGKLLTGIGKQLAPNNKEQRERYADEKKNGRNVPIHTARSAAALWRPPGAEAERGRD